MDKKELQSTIDYLKEQCLRIRTTKTNILETQGTLIGEDYYDDNDCELDRLFDSIDDKLYEAKKALEDVISCLESNMD